MKKDSFIKDALVLTAITLISGLLLGAVYGATKDTIAEAIRQKTNAAYKVVLDAHDYDADSLKEKLEQATTEGKLAANNGNASLSEAILAKDESGNTVGYVLKGQAAGYGGAVVVAKVGHIPSIMIKVGFSLNIPFIILSKYLFILPLPTFPHTLPQTPWQHLLHW